MGLAVARKRMMAGHDECRDERDKDAATEPGNKTERRAKEVDLERGVQDDVGGGGMLFLAGEQPKGLNIVTAGQVKFFVLSAQTGREVILMVEHPYNAVAELPSLDGGDYPANAQAVGETEMLFLEQNALLGALRERPEVSLHLVRTLGGRLRRLVNLVEQLSFQEVVHRLASYLLECAGLPGCRLNSRPTPLLPRDSLPCRNSSAVTSPCSISRV